MPKTGKAGSTPTRQSTRRLKTPSRLGQGDGWGSTADSDWAPSVATPEPRRRTSRAEIKPTATPVAEKKPITTPPASTGKSSAATAPPSGSSSDSWTTLLAKLFLGLAILSSIPGEPMTKVPVVGDYLNKAVKLTFITPTAFLIYAPVSLPSCFIDSSSGYFRAYTAATGVTLTEFEIGEEKGNLEKMYPEKYVKGEHLPEKLRGIWWMDGNGRGIGDSDVASLAAGKWDSKTNTLEFPLYAPWTFSHFPTHGTDVLRAFSWRWTYIFQFNPELTEADITLRLFGVDIPSGGMGAFKMKSDPAKPGEWLRESWYGDAVGDPTHTYYLKQVVSPDGKINAGNFQKFTDAYTRKDGESTNGQTSPTQLIRTA